MAGKTMEDNINEANDLAAMKQGWEDRGTYVDMINWLEEIRNALDVLDTKILSAGVEITLKKFDYTAKRIEETYGKGFVEEYTSIRKELTQFIGEDKK